MGLQVLYSLHGAGAGAGKWSVHWVLYQDQQPSLTAMWYQAQHPPESSRRSSPPRKVENEERCHSHPARWWSIWLWKDIKFKWVGETANNYPQAGLDYGNHRKDNQTNWLVTTMVFLAKPVNIVGQARVRVRVVDWCCWIISQMLQMAQNVPLRPPPVLKRSTTISHEKQITHPIMSQISRVNIP